MVSILVPCAYTAKETERDPTAAEYYALSFIHIRHAGTINVIKGLLKDAFICKNAKISRNEEECKNESSAMCILFSEKFWSNIIFIFF